VKGKLAQNLENQEMSNKINKRALTYETITNFLQWLIFIAIAIVAISLLVKRLTS